MLRIDSVGAMVLCPMLFFYLRVVDRGIIYLLNACLAMSSGVGVFPLFIGLLVGLDLSNGVGKGIRKKLWRMLWCVCDLFYLVGE